MKRVLIVDDEEDLRGIIREVLSNEGFLTGEASNGRQAVSLFKKQAPDAVLLDLKMPVMDGITAMDELRKINSDVPVIILTGHGDVDTAVKAIKAGAYDFTLKPPDFDRLLLTLRRAIERRELQQEVERVNTALESSLENLFGKSDSVKAVIDQIKQVSGTDYSVIIQGETGTGKSVVAEAIKNISRRSEKPFVCVDIGLIPDLLVESELFGCRKGAFTGAEKDRTGYIEMANQGTIFLDELENMSPHVQAKLLSFIEKKKIYPLGGTQAVDIDVRIIAATNKDVRECVSKGEFREDLFYRLGEFIIQLPPLRERVKDIPFFAAKFVFDACMELNRRNKTLAAAALDFLMAHSWPGNLRELKNVMRRAALMAEGEEIDRRCLESLMTRTHSGERSASSLPLREAVKDLERKIIKNALEKTGGNKSRAAEMLEISYKNLFDKIKEYGL
jgi:DNA-binding NtrC family response regulator